MIWKVEAKFCSPHGSLWIEFYTQSVASTLKVYYDYPSSELFS